ARRQLLRQIRISHNLDGRDDQICGVHFLQAAHGADVGDLFRTFRTNQRQAFAVDDLTSCRTHDVGNVMSCLSQLAAIVTTNGTCTNEHDLHVLFISFCVMMARLKHRAKLGALLTTAIMDGSGQCPAKSTWWRLAPARPLARGRAASAWKYQSPRPCRRPHRQ